MHLQNQIVCIRTRDEMGSEVCQHLRKRSAGRIGGLPQFTTPPLLREEPPGPDGGEGFHAFLGLLGIVTVFEGRIGSECGNLSFQSDDAMRIGLGCA